VSDDDPGDAVEGDAARTHPAHWSLTIGFGAAVLVAMLCVAAGLASARVDVALLALPFLASAAWVWDRRARQDDGTRVEVLLARQEEEATIRYTVRVSPPRGTAVVQLRLAPLGQPPQELALSGHAAEVSGTVPMLHSGRLEIVSLQYRLIGADGSFVTVPAPPFRVENVVAPQVQQISSLPLPRQLPGVTGAHESARPGDGGDFRDIHPFTPGDRLRRIDWKRTARWAQSPGELYVRRTAALADASVLLVMDSRDDIGEFVGTWGKNPPAEQGTTSTDVAREAASSLAAAYIRSGDRVGFQDLGGDGRMLAPASGARQLSRLFSIITLSRPSEQAVVDRRRPPVVPPGVLIYLFSSFLDGEAARLATFWRAGGHRVIGVDVLPSPRFRSLTGDSQAAARIIAMEREDRLELLVASGVELLRWRDDAGSRAASLRALSRPAQGRPMQGRP
jgi:uncharacterized protein (DUF58 family)